MSAMWNSLIEESETILKKIDKEIDKLKTLKIKKELEVDTRVNLSKEIAELKDDIEYFCKKLGITNIEFENIMNAKIHGFDDFPNNKAKYNLMKKLQNFIMSVFNKNLANYS